MREDRQRSNPDRLILLIKSAYWMALLIIAGMAFATYLLLQNMTANYQRDEEMMALAGAQKTLSQRIVFLANAARLAPLESRSPLVESLREATQAFEANYDSVLYRVQADNLVPEFEGRTEAGKILFHWPYHLDYFSSTLAANGYRFVSAQETELGLNPSPTGYQGGADRAELDETVAKATLDGYAALRTHFEARAFSALDRVLNAQRLLFLATIGVICLIALFIFQPMTDVIRRRTSELVEARNSMASLAIHDGLTGLYNRIFLRNNFDTLIETARRRNERLAVIQIDLDRFKQINDTLGHAAGDHVLVITAERIRRASRDCDLCARLGGDEFVIVMPSACSPQEMDALARRMLHSINEPIAYDGATIFSGASAGIAIYPVDAGSATDLMVHADLALYAAKRKGGGYFSFFSEELRTELEHRKTLEQDIADAVANEAFSVHFQPQINLADGAVAGVEALVRWNHPQRGMVSPGEFIPIAEKSGAMPAVGRIVITKAIREAASWHRAGIEFGRLAVNVSGVELREAGFTRFLFDALETEGLPTDKLALEIVESVILDDEKTGIASKLRMIRAAGVHLELDDFGTGYASLSHVNPNEIDRLKIDRRFVQNINLNDGNSKIVRAITELARGLGISIVAEGAETEEELSVLLAIGCDQVQGYSIAFPMPRNETRDWLAKRPARAMARQAVRA